MKRSVGRNLVLAVLGFYLSLPVLQAQEVIDRPAIPGSHHEPLHPLEYKLSSDSMVNVFASYRRSYTTVRTQHRPRIDGFLDDACWQQEGEWSGDFVQQAPNQAHIPSEKTEIKILYDDNNLYIAIKCYDKTPNGITALLGRRDDFSNGDITGVALDTYHDHSTAFEFNVTAAGQKVDLMHLGAFKWDTDWNAVWEGKSQVQDSMWTAEMEVPFSQIRFSHESEQVWGMHIWRWIARTGEEDQWKLIPIDAPAMVYIFGELNGIKDIPQKRHFELLPYGALRYQTDDGGKNRIGLGLDGKAALSSNFILDYTLFPDFGQVEADPSVLNLTSYEIFYQEKRPFFLEGNAILKYDIGSDLLFYSRRIGHAPTYQPPVFGNEQLITPSATNIINALKVTGKSKNGLSVGVVNSIAQQEFAEVRNGSNKTKYAVEPFTNYFVARAKQDFNQGNTTFGGMFTSVLRSLQDPNLKSLLPGQAFTGGLDLLHTWQNRKYFIDAKTFFSSLRGTPSSISLLEQSPIHLYQRIDAPHLNLDPQLEQLNGWGGDIEGGKQSGKLRATAGLSWRTPGLDLNDVGYLREADVLSQKAAITYNVNKPVGILRKYQVTLAQQHDWNFGGENTLDLLQLEGQSTFTNLWTLQANLTHAFYVLDIRQLRGGPALRKDPHSMAGFLWSTNTAKNYSLGIGMDRTWSDNGLSHAYDALFNFQLKFNGRFIITSNTFFEKVTENNQFVPSPTRNIAGNIKYQTVYTTLRAEYFVTPELSIQYYGSPYSSIGYFDKIYLVKDAHASDPEVRYKELTYFTDDPDYQYYAETNNGNVTLWKINHPDFNFQEFRSNFVVRWEYKAGSTAYFVWTHGRSHYEDLYRPNVVEQFRGLGDAAGQNAFTVKWSYWIGF